MAGKRLEYEIGVDPSKGIQGLKQFSSAAKKAMREVDDSMDDTTTSAQKVAKALSGMADEIEQEMKGAAKASEALATALGPELAGRANVDQVVQDLKKMGLTFDEITADADTLAGALKKLDGVQMAGAAGEMDRLEGSTRRAKGNVDDLGKSADSSKSVLANMVGNSTQDLGALGGVAGSAGVAIGQMGEYMADAAGSGDKLGQILKGFGGVAVPLAAVSIATQAISGHFEKMAEDEKFAGDQMKRFSESIQQGADGAQVLRDELEATGELKFNVQIAGPDIRGGDIVGPLARAGLELKDFVALSKISNEEFRKWRDAAEAAGVSTQDLGEISLALAGYFQQQSSASANAANNAEVLGKKIVTQRDAILAATKAQRARVDANKAANDAQVAKDVEALNQAYRDAATPMENYTRIQEEAADQSERVADIMGKQRQAMADLADMAGPFEEMARNEDALSSIFDLKNAPKKAAGEVRDIALEIGKLSDVAAGVKVGEALAGSVKADDFLDAIDALAPDIQAKITEAFSTGGEGEARATALRYIAEVTKELGGKFTPAQVAKMLGLDDFEATIGLAIEQTAVDKARRQLEVLVGVGGETPYTASIALALDAGEITGEQAQTLIQPELDKAGVTIPTSLQQPVTQETLEDAQIALNKGKPLTVPAVLTINEVTAIGGGKYRMKNGVIMQDAGGTTPFPGGIVAEKGAEIVRYPGQRRDVLVTRPSYVPPGTRVTSRKKTARILSHGGRLRRYDSGGMVAPVSINPTININAGVVGDTYAVMQAVDQANRRIARLLPTHP